jgi:hypothetical protein
MKVCLKKAEKVLNGPRGAKDELSKMTFPAGDVRFEAIVKALEKVLEAAEQGKSNVAIRAIAKAEVEKLLADEKSYNSKGAELSKQGDVIDKEIEKWSRRKENAPEKEAMEKELEIKWAKENAEKNESCLQLMRSYIPSDIRDLVAETLAKRVEATGKFYPRATSERLRSMKMLQWLVTHPNDIKNANFLKGGTRVAFLNLGEYDIVELRAVFSVVPDHFDLDSDGEKKRWREALVKILKERAASEENKTLPENHIRNPVYTYPTPEAMEAQRRAFKDRVDRLAVAKAELTRLNNENEDAKRDFDEAMEKFRDKEAIAKYGKDKLRDDKDGLKKVFEEKKKFLRAQQGKVDSATRACEKDKIERAEMETEARKIKLYNGYGKQVTPAFSKNPVLKEVERLKKMTEAEEAAARKKEVAAAVKAKADGDNGSGDGTAAAAGGAAAGGGAGGKNGGGGGSGGAKKERVRSEAEIFDSHMDFKVKKSGAMDVKNVCLLLLDLGWSPSGSSTGVSAGSAKAATPVAVSEAAALEANVGPKEVEKLTSALDPKKEGRIEKKRIVDWWVASAQPLVSDLVSAAMGSEERAMKVAMNACSSSMEEAVAAGAWVKHHPSFLECQACLVAKTGSGNTIINQASEDDNFKNKLGAIFGGGKPAPGPKPSSAAAPPPKKLGAASEDAKNKLGALFGGGGGGAPASKPGAAATTASSSSSSSPGDSGAATNPLISGSGGGDSKPAPPPPAKTMSLAQQRAKEMEEKMKASGGGGKALSPMNRLSSETKIVSSN